MNSLSYSFLICLFSKYMKSCKFFQKLIMSLKGGGCCVVYKGGMFCVVYKLNNFY